MKAITQRPIKNARASVTIKQVAAAAQVAVGTVSRVINGHANVDRRLRSKVENAIRVLGYHPNVFAQSIARNHSPILSFVLINCDVFNSAQALILMGIEEYCEQAGYYVLFTRFQYADEMDPRKVRLPGVLENNGLTRGVIVAGHVRETFLDVLKKRGITYVALANHVASKYAQDAVNQVLFDDDRGFYDATNYLIELGHKEIWFIGDTSRPEFRARYDGYRRSMAEHALQPRAQRLALSDNDFDNGRRSLELIVEEGGKMTAVIAGSDDLALGAIEMLRQSGKDVPRDVSVIGFEHMADRNRAAHLSSVCVDTIQVGRELGRSLIARIRGHGTHVPLTLVPTVLVKRGTCRPLRAETSRMVL